MSTRRHSLKSALAAAAALTLLPLAAQAADVTLRFHQMLPPQATIPAKAIKVWAEKGVFEPWCAKLGKESNNRIKCQIYPAMQLGGTPPQLYDQAKDGVVDLIWTVLGYTPGRFPKSEVFELPFSTGNAEAGSKAFQEYVEKNAMDEFKDVKLIGVHCRTTW